MLDIGDIIQFKNPSNGGIQKTTMGSVLNKSLIIKRWELKKSKFDNHDDFVEIILEMDGQDYKLNTASEVIMSQLDEISQKYPTGLEFTCVIKQYGKFTKMFPIKKNEVEQ